MRIPQARSSRIFILGTIFTLLLLPCFGILTSQVEGARENIFASITEQVTQLTSSPFLTGRAISSATAFAPTLGNYSDTTVQLGANATITPDAAPVGATSINVSTSIKFKGKLTADPATGVIRITNARPAGTHTLTVKAFDSLGATTTTTFTLTVNTPFACVSLSFAAASNFSAGTSPNGVAIGDFNNDGNQDFAVASQTSSNVTVWLGNGTGGFTSGANFPTGGNAFSIAVGDFNNDGKQDMAACNRSPANNVAILIGDGLGSFTRTNVGAGSSSIQAVIGDFNNDNKQDLVTANNTSNNVTLLLGNGAGGFASGGTFAVGTAPDGLAVGDFNSDNNQDVVTTSSNTSNLSLLTGNGAGSFATAVAIPAGSVSGKITTGDFNGDTHQDIAFSTFSASRTTVLLNNGAGGFTSAGTFNGSLTNGIDVGDINGDGNQDVAVANSGGGSVSIIRGNGTGGFSTPTTLSAGSFTTWVAIGDFNNDGRQDIVACNSIAGHASVFLSNCTTNAPPANTAPTFLNVSNQTSRQGAPVSNSQIATVSDTEQAANTLAVTVNNSASATVNGVTVSNIVVSNTGAVTADIAASCVATTASFTLKVMDSAGLNNTATLTVTANPNSQPVLGNYPITAMPPGGSATITPDIPPTDDGIITNITASAPGFTGTLSVNQATGAVSVSNAGPSGSFLVTVTATDDCGATDSKTFTLNLETCTGIAFAKGPGSPILVGPDDPFYIATGDFNRDNKIDLAVIKINSSDVRILLGTGTGGFTPVPSPVINVPVSMDFAVVADFNVDSKPDLALSNSGANNIIILLGDGLGGFVMAGPPTNVIAGAFPRSIAVGDFNLDNKPDIVTANTEIDNLGILLGDGLGGFVPASGSPVTVGMRPEAVVVGDFNLDNKADLAVANTNSNNVTILIGNGIGGFAPAAGSPIAVGGDPVEIAVSDFNLDNKPDLVTANRLSDGMSILLGNGLGGFALTAESPIPIIFDPYIIAPPADFNLDGNPDLVVRVPITNRLVVMRGDGLGGFTLSNMDFDFDPFLVTSGDFNMDGRPDLATATLDNDSVTILLNTCPQNALPVITVNPVSLHQGTFTPGAHIATVSDAEQAANTLNVTATPLTGSGVTVTDISIDPSGNVFADITASCTATNSTFTLAATDNQNATTTATLTVNVIPNTPPALGNYTTTTVSIGTSTTVTPDAAPVDNFTITSITASAPDFTGTLSVDPISGVITVSNAAPVGSYTVTVTATDNCGATSIKTFTLNVICPIYTVNSLGDTGAGTGTTGDLRYCITQANAQLCNITINFSVTGVINLTSELPALNNNITFNGPGAALLDIHRNVATAFRIFTVNSGKTVSLSGLTISNGEALHGGGIENSGTLTITDSLLTNNIATIMFTANDGGGAIFNNGALTITGSFFTGNHADNANAGAIYNNFGAALNITGSTLSNNVSCHGGAIHHRGSNLTVTSSTFSGNFSGVCGGGPGGAVSIFNAHATFTNCTISGNVAQANFGSGISAFLGSITLLNCTVTANGGETSTGSLAVQNATLNIKNSIVAGNTGGDIVNNGGTVNNEGNNILSGDPMLAPLGNYGGPTQTHALCTGSPAIDAGNNTGAPATDQRGVSRPVGETVDIGAFEANIFVDQSSISSGTQFAPYAGQTFTASNGVAPYTFNVIGTLPAGMTFSDGTLSGTPTETGSFPIKIIAIDSEGFAGAGCYTLIIECPTITLSPSSLANGTGGVNYNQVVSASGGESPYTFALTAGALPPGLMLSSAGTLRGNPTATGTYNFTITATAANDCTGSQSYTISINMPPTITAADPLTRERGATASTSQIAVVADAEQAPNTLNVTAIPLTGTGVTITGITIDAAGNVTASIVADCAATNSTFTLKVTDNLGVMATATLTVNTIPDSQPPVIICPANITQATDPNLCSAVVSYTTPEATDNCPNPGTVVCTPASGSAFPKGTTTVTCTVDDASGNTGSCSFTVTINDTQAPSISCPSNITQSTDADQCTAVVTFSPTATDNCPDVGIVTCKPASGSTFQKGVTSVTCTVTDASGNVNSCSFTVTVNDTQSPSMTCPANITQGNDNDQCAAIVNYTTPTATDNCPGVGAVTCNPPAGSAFPKGTTTVNCSVNDANGNNRSCNFTVTVNDTQTPTVNCPTSITTTTAVGLCSAVVTFSATTNDNCSGATVSCTPASGSTFPKGITTVTCRATDASGNQSTPCSFTVTVNDTQFPTISCPSNMTKATDLNLCSAVVSYAAPVVSDNCPGLAAPVCTPPSGATFPKGTTTVNCSVRDASNNQSSCSFTVTINDTQAPSLTCPPNQTRALASATDTTVIVDYPLPTYGDNCPGSTVVCNPPSGAAFPVGMTTVTCVATDSSGNQASCSFIVTTFDICLQDDSNPATVILFNSFTGNYLFCCSGTTYSGKGTVQKQGNIYTLTHNTSARRVIARFDGAQKKGTASLQSPPGTIRCSINDRDTRNNTCSCSSN